MVEGRARTHIHSHIKYVLKRHAGRRGLVAKSIDQTILHNRRGGSSELRVLEFGWVDGCVRDGV